MHVVQISFLPYVCSLLFFWFFVFDSLSQDSKKGGTNGSGEKRSDFRDIQKVEPIEYAHIYD